MELLSYTFGFGKISKYIIQNYIRIIVELIFKDLQYTEFSREVSIYHYLGAASGCLTVRAEYENSTIGVWVFMKREAGEILWHRACWDHNYRAWNPHEKALKLAIPELKKLGFTKIITFADLRWHTGELYEKLGFTFETEIESSYYYSNGKERKSKYVFRVPAGVSEVEEAHKKGWHRVFDIGKKRFVMFI